MDVYALFAGWHGKLVERAAPGGEGNVIDHFSRDAIRGYLAHVRSRVLPDSRRAGLRAFFNDSYEVDDATGQADWTPALFDEFQQAARLRSAAASAGAPVRIGDTGDDRRRVCWPTTARRSPICCSRRSRRSGRPGRARRGALVRNQAHGSPANLLDLYAASDIPETEGTEIAALQVGDLRGARRRPAAGLGRSRHVARRAFHDDARRSAIGRRSVLRARRQPHRVSRHGVLARRRSVARLAVLRERGVQPRNAWWDDFAALNQYVTRVQSFLQADAPDHDVLLYFPFYDAVADRGTALLTHFGGANRPTAAKAFEAAARGPAARGFTYDYISDRQLTATRVVDGRLVTGGGSTYRVLVIPSARYIPLETLERVLTLARAGATIVLSKGWPLDVAGLHDLDARRRRFRDLTSAVNFGLAPMASGGASRSWPVADGR